MRRKTNDFGRLNLILVVIFLFVAVLLPRFLNAGATDGLGSFAEGETGIKLCAVINGGNENELRFSVSNDQGFQSDVLVANNSCRKIAAVSASYTVRQYPSQDYTLAGVSGGTINANGASFIAISEGQYTIIFTNNFANKGYLHINGRSSAIAHATIYEITFDANGGAGDMTNQRYSLYLSQPLSANSFSRNGYTFGGWNTKADGTGESYTDGQILSFLNGGELTLYAQWTEQSQPIPDPDNNSEENTENTENDTEPETTTDESQADNEEQTQEGNDAPSQTDQE